MKPHLIMPMGGAGSRFFTSGYIQPKPLIKINGKPFFYWAALSLLKYINVEDITFVILRQHIDDFEMDNIIRDFFPEARITIIPEVLPGSVFTALKGTENIDDENVVIFNDCDHMFKCSSLNECFSQELFLGDAALLTFESNEPHFSYVRYDKEKIVGTVEKKVVSNHAICGAYAFKNVEIFKKMALEYIKNCPYNECFMSGIYNVIYNKGLEIREYVLDYHVEYGTPEEYEIAKQSKYFADFL